MTIPNTNITWTSLKNEFGGASNNIHEGYYYRGFYVPYLTSNVNVPTTRANISASSLKGSTKQIYFINQYIDKTGLSYSSDYNSTHFSQLDGGTSFNVWTDVYSNVITSVTTPNTTLPLKMFTDGFSITLANGYRWYNDGYKTSYWYDHSRIPGLAIFNDAGTIVASSNSSDTTDYWYNGSPSSGTPYVPGIAPFIVQPNKTYTIRYKINWYNDSAGYNYLSVSGNPSVYAYNY